MKIFILNDTSPQPHAGCRAVMASLNSKVSGVIGRHYVATSDLDESFDEADAIIANGEGTIHHNSKHAVFIMESLAKAQASGKKTLLINATLQNTPPFFRDVFENLTLLTVREGRSRDNALACGAKSVLVYPDLCIDTPIPSGPKATGVVVGCSGALGQRGEDFKAIPGQRVTLTPDVPFGASVAMLSSADCYVTGQHHGVYAALMAGIPFVAIPSNTYKIEGTLEMIGGPEVIQPHEKLENAINAAMQHREFFKALSQRIWTLPRLTKDILDTYLGY
jgi:polysaccharide pyruvyl transferase WcaK-like protein